jgi:hypothetical protein
MNAPEQLLAELELLADWRDDLLARFERAQAILETVGLDVELHRALYAEGRRFCRVCATMAERIPGSLVAEQRQAA